MTRWPRWAQDVVNYSLSIIALLVLWQLVHDLAQIVFPPTIIGTNTLANPRAMIIPGPREAFGALVDNWQDINRDLLASSLRLVLGLLISLVTAAPLGLLIGSQRYLNSLLTPLIYTIYPIPKVVFWPVLLILFTIGESSKISFIILMIFFQILLSARDAAQHVPRSYIVSALASGAKRAQLFWHVILPASLPEIFTSLRVSLGIGIAALYISETTIRPTFGLAKTIQQSADVFAYAHAFAGIMALAFLGLLIYLVIEVIERFVCRWKYL
jgi:NitT/TauT family transport system permease protein